MAGNGGLKLLIFVQPRTGDPWLVARVIDASETRSPSSCEDDP